MSGVVEVIAQTLTQHRWVEWISACSCRQWFWDTPRTHFCGEEERITKAHDRHVAEMVAAALTKPPALQLANQDCSGITWTGQPE